MALSGSDRGLAERLEAVEAENLAEMARALAAAQPDSGAFAEPHAGGIAVFAGVDSPMTHALGIGMRGPVSLQEFDRLENFFRVRHTASVIDLCPLAHASVIECVQTRGYRITEFNNVLARRMAPGEEFPLPSGCGIRIAAEDELILWSRLVVQGFQESDCVNEEFVKLMAATCAGSTCFLGLDADAPSAAASMGMRGRTACFYGDSTLPRSRGRGLHSALIAARLAYACGRGCDLAMASVLPGSGSHRNYERAGFRLVYTRVNVTRKWR